MGGAGAVALVAGLVLMLMSNASAVSVLIYCVVLAATLFGVIKLALWSIRKTKKTGSIYLNSDQEGFRSSSYEEELVGKKGVCRTLLHPGGFVMIEGKKYAAISASGFAEKGDEVEVLEVEGETLKVRKI